MPVLGGADDEATLPAADRTEEVDDAAAHLVTFRLELKRSIGIDRDEVGEIGTLAEFLRGHPSIESTRVRTGRFPARALPAILAPVARPSRTASSLGTIGLPGVARKFSRAVTRYPGPFSGSERIPWDSTASPVPGASSDGMEESGCD